MKWIKFEDKKPNPGQEILIVWPSGTIKPEYRVLSKEDLEDNWDDMRWLPIPNYPSIQ